MPATNQGAIMATEKKVPEIETVTMEDGRVVEFVGKRKMLKDSFVSEDGKISTRIDFRNGKSITFTIPDALIAKCAGHGAEQKLGDETAGLEDIDDAYMAVEALVKRLNDQGIDGWTQAREGNGLAGTSVLARALAELKGIPMDKVKAFLADKTAAQKLALRANEQLKPIIARIEAEKAAKNTGAAKVDTEALLGELA
jgi:hypothetical protein